MQTGAHAQVQPHDVVAEPASQAPSAAKDFASAYGNAALARKITALNSAALARNGQDKKKEDDTPESRAKKAASQAMPPQFGDFLHVAWGGMLPGVKKSMAANKTLFGRSFKVDKAIVTIPIFPPLVWFRFGGGVEAAAKITGAYSLGYKREPAPMDKPWAVEDRIEGDGKVDFDGKAKGGVWSELLGGFPEVVSAAARVSAGVELEGKGAVQVFGNLTRNGMDPDKGQMNKFIGSLAYKVNFKTDMFAKAEAGFHLRTPIKDTDEEASVTIGSWKIGWFEITGNGFVDPNTGVVRNNLKIHGGFGEEPKPEKRRYKLDSRATQIGPRYASAERPALEEPTLASSGGPPGGGPPGGGPPGDEDIGAGDSGPVPAVVA